MKKFSQFVFELDHMSKILTKKGENFVDKLLSSKLQINMKVDTSAFIIRKVKGELSYWGREGAQELDKIKRAGSDIWEPSIAHIEKQNWQSLPDDITVATEMYNPRIATLIKWTKAPKNGMIISYIKKGGKIVPLNDPLYKKVADTLKIAPPPVIFDGTLSSKQKDELKELISDPDIKTGEDFAKHILSLFAVKKDIDFLYNTGFIEGLVFYFADGSSAKITDNFFTTVNKAKNANKANEYFDKVSGIAYDNLEAATDRILSNKSSMKKIMAQTGEDRYIAFISALTGSIYQKVGRGVKGIDKYKQDVEEGRYSNISSDFISPGMKALVARKWWIEDLWRIMLYGIRKEKKRVNLRSGLTAGRKDVINSTVQKLKDAEIL